MLSEQPARTARAAPGEPSSQMESVSRRTFLQASAAAGGGLLLSLALPVRHAAGTPPVEEFAPNAFVRIGAGWPHHADHDPGRDGTRHLHVHAHAHCRGTGSGSRSGPSRTRAARRRALRKSPCRLPSDRRLDLGSRLLETVARSRCRRAHAACRSGGANLGRGALVLPRGNRLCDPQRNRPQARLRRARGEGGNAAGARGRQNRAQGPQGLQADRHARQAARHARQG